jgi:hypothetical protein
MQHLVSNLFSVQKKKSYQYKILLIIFLSWSVNCFLSWLYLCKINYECSFTRLVTGYVSGAFFWLIFFHLITEGIQNIKKLEVGLFKKLALISFGGVVLLVLNQWFVYKVIALAYSIFWSYFEPNQSWINEVITNNILINIFFFCLIAQVAWAKTDSHNKTTEPINGSKTYPDKIVIKDGPSSHLVGIDTIRFIQVEQNCIHIHTPSRKYVMYISLVNFSKGLPPEVFIKIHRSTVVNQKRIRQVRNLPSGDAEVFLECGAVLKCSRSYKKNLSVYFG